MAICDPDQARAAETGAKAMMPIAGPLRDAAGSSSRARSAGRSSTTSCPRSPTPATPTSASSSRPITRRWRATTPAPGGRAVCARLRRPGRADRHRRTPSPRPRRGPATTRSSSSTATTTMLCGRWRRSSDAPARPRRSIGPRRCVARSNIPADRIRAFALGVVEDGRLARIVEKPTPEQAAAPRRRARQHDLLADAAGNPRGLPAGDALGARRVRAGGRGQRADRRRRPLRGRRRRRTASSTCPGAATSRPSSRRWRASTVDP